MEHIVNIVNIVKLYNLGKQLHNCERWMNYRRVIVFVIRSLIHHKEVQILCNFFHSSSLRRNIITTHPTFFVQLTRHIFYKGSTISERLAIIMQSSVVLENKFTEQALQEIYLGPGIRLWSQFYKEQPLSIDLVFRGSEFKEGSMTLGLKLNNKYIYHINFWIVLDERNNSSLYIGTLQGSLNGLSINKELTKYFWGCRPQNLIVYALRILAERLSCDAIYAVSNYGFYTNNHWGQDRKLKTSLDHFWTEIGGNLSQDRRFFILPPTEQRKNIEEVASHKRNLYRKRFATLDVVNANITNKLDIFMKNNPNIEASPEMLSLLN